MAKKLNVLPLERENFKEFGAIIAGDHKSPDGGDENFNWWERLGLFKGIEPVSLNILEAKIRDRKIAKLEFHRETPEAIIPLGGEDVILVVAPAGPFDESKMKAFRVESGKGVILAPGVRHSIPYPTTKNVNCLIVFKDATGVNDLTFDQLSEIYQF